MRRFISALLAAILSTSAQAQAGGGQAPCLELPCPVVKCSGFVDGSARPEDVEHFYSRRAVQIIRAAMAGDDAKLKTMVAPHARFELWRGDYAFAARSNGPRGAIELAGDLKARRFVVSVVQRSIRLQPLKCEWEQTILFETDQPGAGVVMKFNFVDGMLVQAKGDAVEVFGGSVP